MDRLIHRILLATGRGLSSTAAVDWHLKRKHRVWCLSNQNLLHYSHHAKNHLNPYIHSADFRVSWTKWPCSFLTIPTQKFVKYLLAFLNLQQHAKKISSFHQFTLEIQSIFESCDQTGHTHFWPCPTKYFLINF